MFSGRGHALLLLGMAIAFWTLLAVGVISGCTFLLKAGRVKPASTETGT
jgi:hypothetical protein